MGVTYQREPGLSGTVMTMPKPSRWIRKLRFRHCATDCFLNERTDGFPLSRRVLFRKKTCK